MKRLAIILIAISCATACGVKRELRLPNAEEKRAEQATEHKSEQK